MDELAPATILVVDDDPEIREMLGMLLDVAGYTVRLAEHGQAAWLICTPTHPRAALCLIYRCPLWMGGRFVRRNSRTLRWRIFR